MDAEGLGVFRKCHYCVIAGKVIAASGDGEFSFYAVLFTNSVSVGIFPSGIFQKLFRFLDTVILERIFAAPWSLRAGAECRCPAAA